MSRTVTLSAMRDRILLRADMRNTGFVSTSELNTLINSKWADFREMLTMEGDTDLYLATATVNVTPGTELYSLPADFARMKHVSIRVFGNDTRPAEPYQLQEIDRFEVPGLGATATIYYLPVQTDLSSDSDTIEGWNGWEKWIELAVAIELLNSEESDPTPLLAEKAEIEKRVRAAASQRDAGRPRRILDVSRRFNDFGLSYQPQDFYYRLQGAQISFRTARDYTVVAT